MSNFDTIGDLDEEERARLRLLLAYGRDRIKGGRSITIRADDVPPKHFDARRPPLLLELDWDEGEDPSRYRLVTWRWMPSTNSGGAAGWAPHRTTHPSPARVKEALTKFLLRGNSMPTDPPISDGSRENQLTKELG